MVKSTRTQFLPFIMVAPNGARRIKADHPALPQTISEIVSTARECADAGAHGIHSHIRDGRGRHLLDVGIYEELLAELALKVPHLLAQITTEAAGIYAPPDQRRMLEVTRVAHLSAALREITADDDISAQRRFYHEAMERGIDIQHILYAPEEALKLDRLITEGILPTAPASCLFVLGKYMPATLGHPDEITDFLKAFKTAGLPKGSRFMVCAFGKTETACLIEATRLGGDCRVGFENNLHHPDGRLAINNAARVAELKAALALASSKAI